MDISPTLESVSFATGISVAGMCTRGNKPAVVLARHIAWYLLCEGSEHGIISECARAFNVNHSSILYGIKRIDNIDDKEVLLMIDKARAVLDIKTIEGHNLTVEEVMIAAADYFGTSVKDIVEIQEKGQSAHATARTVSCYIIRAFVKVDGKQLTWKAIAEHLGYREPATATKAYSRLVSCYFRRDARRKRWDHMNALLYSLVGVGAGSPIELRPPKEIFLPSKKRGYKIRAGRICTGCKGMGLTNYPADPMGDRGPIKIAVKCELCAGRGSTGGRTGE